MLDMKFIRDNREKVEAMLIDRNSTVHLAPMFDLDGKRRVILSEVEALKAERNARSKEIGRLKAAGADVESVKAEVGAIGDKISALDGELREVESELRDLLLRVPNMVQSTVPRGVDDSFNVEMRRWGEIPSIENPKSHFELGEALGIMDQQRAAKVSGSRFTFMMGLGARLERAVMNFYMDTHASRGYKEVLPPYIVNSASMTGTGQLPKFQEDMYRLEGLDEYLIPTAEVPATNYYRDEILDAKMLPIKFCCYSACFRAEAGAAGKDSRGLIRQHQFNKVELVKYALPEQSNAELESMTADAEFVLQQLGLPYRVVVLSSGDMGFSSSKTYDIEVWMPAQNKYREISSCSNCLDFQARRAGIKFRREPKAKPEFIHTLNGSGVAVGRTVAAILECYQQPDGSVKVPDVLIPYMRGVDVIK